MKHLCAVLILLIALTIPLSAQDTHQNAQGMDYFGGLHKKGSQLISLSAGTEIPLFIIPQDSGATETYPLGFGASFSLEYQYFIANRLTLGGSLTGAFNTTVAGRTLFIAPIAAHMGYFWGIAPMEYSLGLDAGITIMRLSGNGVITPFTKLNFGIFRQISESWSLGGNLSYWLIPEIHTGAYSNLTRYGNFLGLTLSALYHF